MKSEIQFKATYLNKLLWRLVYIGGVVSIIIFSGLDIDLSYRYFLSMVVIFIGLLIVFYLNKNELEKLIIGEKDLELLFFNKVFFKQKSSIQEKQKLNVRLNDDIIELYKDNKIIGKIRKVSVDIDNWDKVRSYFNLE